MYLFNIETMSKSSEAVILSMAAKPFDVAEPMHWIDAPDGTNHSTGLAEND